MLQPRWMRTDDNPPPGLSQRFNAITDFMLDPCVAPWWVYLETAKKPAGEFALALLTPSPGEIAQNYLRPKRPGSCFKGRRRTRANRLARFFPDVDELIANRIPGRRLAAQRIAGPAEAGIWNVIDVADRALFYWMLLDLGSEFLYDWTSAMMRTEYCQASTTARLSGSGSYSQAVNITGWLTIPILGDFRTFGNCSVSIGSINFFDDRVTAIFSGTVENIFDNPTQVAIRLNGAGLGETRPRPEQVIALPPNSSQEFTIKATTPKSGRVSLEMSKNPDTADPISRGVTIMAQAVS